MDTLTKTSYMCPGCEREIYYDGATDEMGCQNSLCCIGMMPKDEYLEKHIKSNKNGKRITKGNNAMVNPEGKKMSKKGTCIDCKRPNMTLPSAGRCGKCYNAFRGKTKGGGRPGSSRKESPAQHKPVISPGVVQQLSEFLKKHDNQVKAGILKEVISEIEDLIAEIEK